MEQHILFIGKNPQLYRAVQQILNKSVYHIHFSSFNEFAHDSHSLEKIDLIVVDTTRFSDEYLHFVHSLKSNQSYHKIPVLALVEASPPRLRYRLVETGVDDYQIIPFDKLDLQVKIRNLLHTNNHNGNYNGAAAKAEPPKSFAILQKISGLLERFNRPLLEFRFDDLVSTILRELKDQLPSHQIVLFHVTGRDLLTSTSMAVDVYPAKEPMELSISGFPSLKNAISQRKPTILKSHSESESFSAYLNSALSIHSQSILVYPLVMKGRVHSLLAVINTSPDKFSNTQYLTVRTFSELIRQAIYVNEIKQVEKNQLDREAWHFYYDFLERIVNKLDFGILVLNRQLEVKFLNEKAAHIFRRSKEDVLNNPLNTVLSEEEVQAILAFKEEDVNTLERPELMIEVGKREKILLGFSVYHYTDDAHQEEGFIVSLKDITIRKELQEEKNRTDRLDSLGNMATGIAHEIRNPLAGIKAIAQTLQEELEEGDQRHEYIKRMIRQVNRLDDLLKSLYLFARPTRPNRAFCSIEDILKDVINSFREELHNKNIQLIETLHSNLPEVYVDDKQIYHVIHNIIKNSIQAINANGEIKVTVKSLQSGTPPSKKLKSLIFGRPYIQIQIQDSGCGIQRENLDKIFNPFFTTKTNAAGLGLSIAYQTVRQNGGLIYFESDVNIGTTCHLILPASD